jgi:hypothetical protein
VTLVAGFERVDRASQRAARVWKIRQRGEVELTRPGDVPMVVLHWWASHRLVMLVLHPRMYWKRAGEQQELLGQQE